MSRFFSVAAGAAALVVCPLLADAQVCPTSLTPLLNWWETSPPFSEITQLRMVVTLRNDETGNLTWDAGNTFDSWSVPGVGEPPVTVNAEPAGTTAPGATFTYDLTFDLSGVPTATAVAFRPNDGDMYGTLIPGQASVVSVEITCAGAAGPAIPELGIWGLIALATAVAAAAVWRLRIG